MGILPVECVGLPDHMLYQRPRRTFVGVRRRCGRRCSRDGVGKFVLLRDGRGSVLADGRDPAGHPAADSRPTTRRPTPAGLG